MEKILRLPSDIEHFCLKHNNFTVPVAPGRDLTLMVPRTAQTRKGLTDQQEQAKLLHNLANIELQAMELAFRSYAEYPEAPQEFREQMAELAISEGQHLALCLEQLNELGYQWGDWPVHLNLWAAVSSEDSLLDRLLIVHRYLEACGLDSGVALMKRLESSGARHVKKAVSVIADEEVGHVEFGSRWYRYFCHEARLDSDHDFKSRLQNLKGRLPRRIEALQVEVRKKAGFTDFEIQAAEEFRRGFLSSKGSETRESLNLKSVSN